MNVRHKNLHYLPRLVLNNACISSSTCLPKRNVSYLFVPSIQVSQLRSAHVSCSLSAHFTLHVISVSLRNGFPGPSDSVARHRCMWCSISRYPFSQRVCRTSLNTLHHTFPTTLIYKHSCPVPSPLSIAPTTHTHSIYRPYATLQWISTVRTAPVRGKQQTSKCKIVLQTGSMLQKRGAMTFVSTHIALTSALRFACQPLLINCGQPRLQ
jgi:hypothetical protein